MDFTCFKVPFLLGGEASFCVCLCTFARQDSAMPNGKKPSAFTVMLHVVRFILLYMRGAECNMNERNMKGNSEHERNMQGNKCNMSGNV